MPSRPKRPADFAQRAKLIIDVATGQAPARTFEPPEAQVDWNGCFKQGVNLKGAYLSLSSSKRAASAPRPAGRQEPH
jgi:hypothetical protein